MQTTLLLQALMTAVQEASSQLDANTQAVAAAHMRQLEEADRNCKRVAEQVGMPNTDGCCRLVAEVGGGGGCFAGQAGLRACTAEANICHAATSAGQGGERGEGADAGGPGGSGG